MPFHEPQISSTRCAVARPVERRGFTIMELLVVVSIIGTLMAFALPTFSQSIRRQTTIAAVDEFVQASVLARSTAQRYGRASQLHIDATNATFWIDVDTNGTSRRAVIGEAHDYSQQAVTLTTTATLLCYEPSGLPATTAGCQSGATSVAFKPTLGSATETRTLQITSLGKVVR